MDLIANDLTPYVECNDLFQFPSYVNWLAVWIWQHRVLDLKCDPHISRDRIEIYKTSKFSGL